MLRVRLRLRCSASIGGPDFTEPPCPPLLPGLIIAFMPRKLSSIAPDWWDYTTLDPDIIRDAAAGRG